MDPPGDGRQPVGPVVDRVEPGDVRQQRLGRADVRRRLLAADVLFARLQRHPVRRVAVDVDRRADDASRRLTHVTPGGSRRTPHAARRTRAARRTAESCRRRRPRPTRRAACRSVSARRSEATATSTPACLRACHEAREVVNAARLRPASGAGRRRRPRPSSADSGSPIANSMPSGSARARSTSIVCGKHESGDEKHGAPACRFDTLRLQAMKHRHRFGGSRRLVQERRVGDLHPGQVGHHRLKGQEAFEAALGDLGLVGRVRACTSRGSRGRCAG